MNASQLDEEAIFQVARRIADPGTRAAYLQQVCGADAALRRRVERLLRVWEEEASFLAAPSSAGTTDRPAAAEGPGESVGPYRLMEAIGEGGMGVVYVAEQHRPVRRKVALKVIKPGMDSKAVVARFEAERQALAMMDHPNIAKVLDAGTTDSGRPYFVMELVRGRPITEYCDVEKLPIEGRLELFVLVCRAVQHAHQKGIIHRDIKPSNVLVTLHDGTPVPKVIDFGVAKAVGQSLTDKTVYTAFAQLIGTPLYMSPEQVELSGLDVDTRSDVYSLGVLLYELLTGTTPFDGEVLRKAAFDEMRRIILEQEPPRPSTRLSSLGETLTGVSERRGSDPRRLDRAVRGELDWIAMKALEKDRRRRYETANDLADDVMRHMTDRPVEACPPSAWYRLRKSARRNRVALTTAALVGLALVAGTAASTWQAWRATAAEGRTRAERDRARLAEARARTEAEKFRAINGLLTDDLLLQAEPENNAVESRVTVNELLDRAAARVPGRFGDRPELEEALRETIAQAYHSLGSWQAAEAQWRAVLASASRRDPDSPSTEKARGSLGHILAHQGRTREAVSLLEQAAARLGRTLGPDHADTLHCRNNLANAYIASGRTAEAIAIYEETLRRRESRFGPEDRDVLTGRANLANAYLRAGRVPEALAQHEQTRRLRESALGPDHPDTLASDNGLANAYLAAGRADEAIRLLRATSGRLDRVLGPDHINSLVCRNNLANACQRTGRAAEAVALLERTVRRQSSKLGDEHPDVLLSRNNLAQAYKGAGRAAEAIALHERTLEQAESALGRDHPETLSFRNNLAQAYNDAGRIAEAIAHYVETVRRAEAAIGADHPHALTYRANLALTYLKAGRVDEAIPMLERTRSLRESVLGPIHPDTVFIMRELAHAYERADRTADAISLYRDRLAVLEPTLGQGHSEVLRCRGALANLYLKDRRPAEALALLEPCLTSPMTGVRPDHPELLAARNNLAAAYRAVGRMPEAIALYEQTLKLCESRFGPEDPRTRITRGNLVDSYGAAGRHAEAEALYAEALRRHRAAEKPDSLLLAQDLARLGSARLRQAKWAEAEPVLRESLAIRSRAIPDDWRKFGAMSLLGEALIGLGRFPEAEALVVAGYKGLAAREASVPEPSRIELPEAADRVVRLYGAWGKAEEAEAWEARLRSAKLPADVFARP